MGVYVCVCVWGGRGVRTNLFCFGGGVLSKSLLDNSSFSTPHLLIIIAQSLTAIWEFCGISSVVFSWDNQVYQLPFLQVSLKIGSSSVLCGYNEPSVKRIGVTSPKVISVAMGGLTIKKAYDRICLEDFRQTCLGRVVGVWERRGSIGFLIFYGSKFNVG